MLINASPAMPLTIRLPLPEVQLNTPLKGPTLTFHYFCPDLEERLFLLRHTGPSLSRLRFRPLSIESFKISLGDAIIRQVFLYGSYGITTALPRGPVCQLNMKNAKQDGPSVGRWPSQKNSILQNKLAFWSARSRRDPLIGCDVTLLLKYGPVGQEPS